MRIRKPVSRFADRPALMLVRVYRSLANFKLRMLRSLLFGSVPEAPKKILIFRTGSLGDSICALPAIEQIKKKYPQATIDILTNAGASNLVSIQKLLHPDQYNSIIDYFGSAIPELSKQIKNSKYDLVIELPQYDSSLFRLIRNMIFFRFKTKINKGFGWQLDNVNAFRKAQNRNVIFEDERTRLLNIINRYTRQAGSELLFPLAIGPGDKAMVDKWLYDNHIDKAQPLIAIVPGAKRHANTWPEENFKQVVDHFSLEAQVVLCGGENEKALAARLKNGHTQVWNACGAFTPVQTSAFFAECQLVITNDTGPLHLAYAAGTPSVSLFSTRDYAYRWFPPQDGVNKIFRATGIECAPCFLENCPYDNKCLRAIKVEEVIAASGTILNNSRRSAEAKS